MEIKYIPSFNYCYACNTNDEGPRVRVSFNDNPEPLHFHKACWNYFVVGISVFNANMNGVEAEKRFGS